VVYLPEALAVARWLRSAAGTEARARFLEKYPSWRERAGDGMEREAELNADWTRREEYERAHKEQWKRRVMCAFNHEGACTIYPVRPMLCREGHAVETNARCCVDVALVDPPRRLTFAPVDEFMERANVLQRATHNAIAGAERAQTRTNRAEALCELGPAERKGHDQALRRHRQHARGARCRAEGASARRSRRPCRRPRPRRTSRRPPSRRRGSRRRGRPRRACRSPSSSGRRCAGRARRRSRRVRGRGCGRRRTGRRTASARPGR